MTILKCKICGGDIEITTDKTFGTCEYCGNTTTFPQIDDGQRVAAFNRGNHFRRIGEFDKALAVYERIVQENDSDAEAHWCCALCRFGIEYVEDPITYEWLPTCHRASFDSFLEDVDYKAALEYSEGITKRQYMKDGTKIAEVQKRILITSQNSEPYDVFICYKETDENGERTRDSIMAQEIYYQLTDQGRKVFFARITLEDVVGTQYEPYIFAALNSAKVMIVVGSKPEYLNAVWVKNEWSRFLAMMKKDHQKLLLPCYKDMDPYDFPEQLSVLQSYDMSKIGFIQDLIRGISKVLDVDKKAETVQETIVIQQSGGTNIAPLLKRAFIFLEDEDWNAADEYCEKVLDIDPECAQAYLGKMMAKLKVKKTKYLVDSEVILEEELLYKKIIRYADADLKKQLESYNEEIKERKEIAHRQKMYELAKDKMISAKTSQDFRDAAINFEKIPDFLDSEDLKAECHTKIIEFLEIERIQKEEAEEKRRIEEERLAEEARIQQLKLEEIRKEKAVKRKKIVKISVPIVIFVLLVVIGICIFNKVFAPKQKYNQALELIKQEKYEDSNQILIELGDYENAQDLIIENNYQLALELIEIENYKEAAAILLDNIDYKETRSLIANIVPWLIESYKEEETTKECVYIVGKEYLEKEKYEEAQGCFQQIKGYKDSDSLMCEVSYTLAQQEYEKGDYSKALRLMNAPYKQNYKDSVVIISKIRIAYAKQNIEEKDADYAINLLNLVIKDNAIDLGEAKKLLLEAKYNAQLFYIENQFATHRYSEELVRADYKDSRKRFFDYMPPLIQQELWHLKE